LELKPNENQEWIETFLTKITYENNLIFLKDYEIESDGDTIPVEKTTMVIQDGLLSEELNYDFIENAWIGDWRWEYTWSNANLTGWKSYSDIDDNGEMEQDGEGIYIYNDDKLQEYDGFELNESGQLFQNDKEIIIYDGDIITGGIDYNLDENDEWIYSFKWVYEYSGIRYFCQYSMPGINRLRNGIARNITDFYYDTLGNLIEKYGESGRELYEYEKGKGNARLLWYFPTNLIYGDPVIKSTSKEYNCLDFIRRNNF